MKCNNCGKAIANDSVFCEFCGKKVSDCPEETIVDDSGKVEGKNPSQKPVEKPKGKKKIILWIVVSCIVFFVVLYVGNVIYHNSDAYWRNYVNSIYSIDIPRGIDQLFFDRYERSFRYYDANTGEQIMWIKGGNVFYGGCESVSDFFDRVISDRYAIPADKSEYTQTTIHGIPALYRIWSNGDETGQSAVLYSEKSGGYIIKCEYPTKKRDYYDEMMHSVIFSFREK